MFPNIEVQGQPSGNQSSGASSGLSENERLGAQTRAEARGTGESSGSETDECQRALDQALTSRPAGRISRTQRRHEYRLDLMYESVYDRFRARTAYLIASRVQRCRANRLVAASNLQDIHLYFRRIGMMTGQNVILIAQFEGGVGHVSSITFGNRARSVEADEDLVTVPRTRYWWASARTRSRIMREARETLSNATTNPQRYRWHFVIWLMENWSSLNQSSLARDCFFIPPTTLQTAAEYCNGLYNHFVSEAHEFTDVCHGDAPGSGILIGNRDCQCTFAKWWTLYEQFRLPVGPVRTYLLTRLAPRFRQFAPPSIRDIQCRCGFIRCD